MVLPGELSQPHAFLENNCAACHTPVKGVEAKNCIVCHADNKTVLQRQPSAFHADISACAACHLEHQGRVPSTTKMDHVALARIGFKQLKSAAIASRRDVAKIKRWLAEKQRRRAATGHSPICTREEALLNCATCHQTKDRHRGLFGNDCAQCHGTTKWTIPEFRHPSSASQSCAQCHQAPPSHYMMHFKMISMKIAGSGKGRGEPMLPLPSNDLVERHQRRRLLQTPLKTEKRAPPPKKTGRGGLLSKKGGRKKNGCVSRR